MPDVDKLIDEALGQEESDLLRRIGGEVSLVERAFSLFGGGAGMVGLVMAAQLGLFLASLWAGWEFFEASDPVTQLRWGLPAAVLVLMSLIIKGALGPALYHNRVMRELKRIELHLARTQG